MKASKFLFKFQIISSSFDFFPFWIFQSMYFLDLTWISQIHLPW